MSKELDITKAVNAIGFNLMEVANMIAAGERGEMLVTRAIILTAAHCARRAQGNWLIMQGLTVDQLVDFFLTPLCSETDETEE